MEPTDSGDKDAKEASVLESGSVEAYAGFAYPEEPRAFLWQGHERRVAEVASRWREPGRAVWVVVDTANQRFQLTYDEASGGWSVQKCDA